MKSFLITVVTSIIMGGLLFLSQRSLVFEKSTEDAATFQEKELPILTKRIDNQYSAWIPYWDEQKSIESINTASNKLETVLPVWYLLDERGELSEYPAEKKSDIRKLALQKGIKIIPTIGNDFKGKNVKTLLKDDKLQKRLIESLVTLANSELYSGFDIDWEEIFEEDRDSFSLFISTLAKRLHDNNLQLSVTVHSQNGKDDWIGVKGQDLKTLAEQADKIRIMIYDFNNENSSPGPVTPLNKMEETLKYSLTQIPSQKIIVGLPTYGYDWSIGKKGSAVIYQGMKESMNTLNGQLYRDESSHSLKYLYTKNGDSHEVWFEDAISIRAKINLAEKYGLNEFCFWKLGGEDPQIWQ